MRNTASPDKLRINEPIDCTPLLLYSISTAAGSLKENSLRWDHTIWVKASQGLDNLKYAFQQTKYFQVTETYTKTKKKQLYEKCTTAHRIKSAKSQDCTHRQYISTHLPYSVSKPQGSCQLSSVARCPVTNIQE